MRCYIKNFSSLCWYCIHVSYQKSMWVTLCQCQFNLTFVMLHHISKLCTFSDWYKLSAFWLLNTGYSVQSIHCLVCLHHLFQCHKNIMCLIFRESLVKTVQKLIFRSVLIVQLYEVILLVNEGMVYNINSLLMRWKFLNQGNKLQTISDAQNICLNNWFQHFDQGNTTNGHGN